MQKRLLALALTLCLALTMIPGAALAAASTLPAVNGVITLTEDVVLTSRYDVTTDTTINLNGHKISGSGNFCLIQVRNGATLTLTGTGTIQQNGSIQAVDVYSGDTNKISKLVIESGVTVTSSSKWTVVVYGNSALTSSGTIANTMPIENNVAGTAISGHGDYHNTVINITGGSVTSTDGFAIYHPQDGTLNISGGTIEGNTGGIEMRSGTLNVTGGTITAEREFQSPAPNGSGSTAWGVAIAVSPYNNADMVINIKGGTITGARSLYVADVSNKTATDRKGLDISVTGGEFIGAVEVAEGTNAPSLTSNAFISGGSYSIAPDSSLIAGDGVAADAGKGTDDAPFTIEEPENHCGVTVVPTELNFGTREAGYTSVAPKTITIANTTSIGFKISCSKMADYDVTISKVEKEVAAQALTGDGNETDSNSVTLNNGEEAIISINPKNGLSAGNHDATLMIIVNYVSEGSTTTPDPSFNVPLKFTVTASTSTGSGISLWYNGGNSFGSSRSATPTAVEIDGKAVSFTGTGREFTVSCVPADAKWVTVRWNSTTVTTNFTPDANASCSAVAIPKTGDMTIVAYAVMAAIAAAGAMLKK